MANEKKQKGKKSPKDKKEKQPQQIEDDEEEWESDDVESVDLAPDLQIQRIPLSGRIRVNFASYDTVVILARDTWEGKLFSEIVSLVLARADTKETKEFQTYLNDLCNLVMHEIMEEDGHVNRPNQKAALVEQCSDLAAKVAKMMKRIGVRFEGKHDFVKILYKHLHRKCLQVYDFIYLYLLFYYIASHSDCRE